MKVFSHIFRQPFVVATGFAALVHSTWALGTLFAGQQPEGWHLVGWLAPALLIAFALDVGQIATSSEIREHGLTLGRGVTFFVFALATYYLQWLYIAHHMPALEIAAGVSDTARATAIYMRDAAIWIIPAFLPLSTVLYTFSGNTAPTASSVVTVEKVEVESKADDKPMLPTEVEENKEAPFGNEVPELVESQLTENRGESESIGMTVSAGLPTTTANGHGKPKTPRNRVKK